ncbi:MAG: SDR family oxidoreductase [Verrucomicrobium sp.]|nr:SDR family oxidoreductase [Verrucomicrobium sp.]
MNGLNDKIALVTGGSRGLGRNAALHLARAGADVLLTYRSKKEEAEETVAAIEALGRKAAALPLDVESTAGFGAFAAEVARVLKEKWGRERFDFLVNNAGVGSTAPFPEMTEEKFDLLLNVQFKGVYFLTQKLLPLLNDGGRIVNLSTGLARFTVPGYSAYAAMKGAVETLSRYLAKELGPRRINVNLVAPGPIETDFTKESLGRPGFKDFLAGQTALGRVGVPDDIGGVVAFLCSEEGRWVNAQRVEASGGLFI